MDETLTSSLLLNGKLLVVVSPVEIIGEHLRRDVEERGNIAKCLKILETRSESSVVSGELGTHLGRIRGGDFLA